MDKIIRRQGPPTKYNDDYLHHLFVNIPNAMTVDDFKALMPQHIDRSILPSIKR